MVNDRNFAAWIACTARIHLAVCGLNSVPTAWNPSLPPV